MEKNGNLLIMCYLISLSVSLSVCLSLSLSLTVQVEGFANLFSDPHWNIAW